MQTELVKRGNSEVLISKDDSVNSGLLDTAKYEAIWRAAAMIAKSDLVPVHYKNKPENCFIAMQRAIRLGVDVFQLMELTYVIHGRIGYEAKLVIALINTRGPFAGPIQWEFEGEGEERKCTAYAAHKQTGEMCAATVSYDMAKKSGWIDRKDSRWATMPDIMMQYRSATILGRLYCPEVLMGVQTVEEVKDDLRNGDDRILTVIPVESKSIEPDSKPGNKARA